MPSNSPYETLSVVKYKNVDIIATTATQVIAGVAGRKLRILAMFISCHVTTTINVQDDEGSPVKLMGGTAQIKLSTDGTAGGYSFTLPYNPAGWFETTAGADLDFVLTGVGSGVAGVVVYVEVLSTAS